MQSAATSKILRQKWKSWLIQWALQAGQRTQGTGGDEGLQESSNEGGDDDESDISSLTASNTNIAKLVCHFNLDVDVITLRSILMAEIW